MRRLPATATTTIPGGAHAVPVAHPQATAQLILEATALRAVT